MTSLRISLDWCASLLLGAGTLFPALPGSATGASPSEGTQNAPEVVPAPPLFDCNGNGVEDSVDIAVGTSSDANWNAIPDEWKVFCRSGTGRAPASAQSRGPRIPLSMEENFRCSWTIEPESRPSDE